MIVKQEGGFQNLSNVVAAQNWAASCVELGGKHARYNGRTRRLEYLYSKSIFKNLWGEKHALENIDQVKTDNINDDAKPLTLTEPKQKAESKPKQRATPKKTPNLQVALKMKEAYQCLGLGR